MCASNTTGVVEAAVLGTVVCTCVVHEWTTLVQDSCAVHSTTSAE